MIIFYANIIKILRNWLCSVGQQGKSPCCGSSPKAARLENFLLRREGQSFVLFSPSSAWMRHTHIPKGQSVFPKVPIETWISSKTILIETFRIMFGQYLGPMAQPIWHLELTITGPKRWRKGRKSKGYFLS